VKIATDDAHGAIHFGRAWSKSTPKRDRDAIIRAIRRRRVPARLRPRLGAFHGEVKIGHSPDVRTTRSCFYALTAGR